MHEDILVAVCKKHIAWNVSKYGVFLGRIFPYFEWIRENTDQQNSLFEQFLRSDGVVDFKYFLL